jgi:hypothetical protein
MKKGEVGDDRSPHLLLWNREVVLHAQDEGKVRHGKAMGRAGREDVFGRNLPHTRSIVPDRLAVVLAPEQDLSSAYLAGKRVPVIDHRLAVIAIPAVQLCALPATGQGRGRPTALTPGARRCLTSTQRQPMRRARTYASTSEGP